MAELFCDICGRSPVRAQILVEGAKLLACGSCMGTGKVLQRFHEDEAGAPVMDAPRTVPEMGGEDVVEECATLIRHARDRVGLPLAVVAERISEKESYLDAIENGRLMPSLAVARKLEKELGIKLIEKSGPSVAPSAAASPSGRFSAPTLADMLSPEKKRKGK